MSVSAAQDCYYHDPDFCGGSWWSCLTCGETFCEEHFHRTDLGENVECVACERERLEGSI